MGVLTRDLCHDNLSGVPQQTDTGRCKHCCQRTHQRWREISSGSCESSAEEDLRELVRIFFVRGSVRPIRVGWGNSELVGDKSLEGGLQHFLSGTQRC